METPSVSDADWVGWRVDPALMKDMVENYRRMWLAAERELWALKQPKGNHLELLEQLRQAEGNMQMHNLYAWATALREAIKIIEKL